MNETNTSNASGVKWDRFSLAALGLLALFVGIGTGIAALAGAATGFSALISFLIFGLCVFGLRFFALQDQQARREKIRARIREELDAANDTEVETSPRPKNTQHDDDVFDAEPQVAEKTIEEPTTENDTPAADPQPAKPVAKENTPKALPRVPRPSYLDAEIVERPEPAPMEKTETPEVTPGVQLKDGVSEEYQAKVSAKANSRLDLDKVLKSRRQAM